MIHKLRKADGIRFLTKGTICRDDITVVPELQTLEIDKRGIYTADEGYVGIGEINVNIPEVTTEEAEVTPNTDTQYVTPKGADYLSKVTVKPIPSTYVPEGYVPRPVFQEKTVTDHSVEVTPDEGYDGLSKVIVAVPEPVLKTKTVSASGTYNAADDGADGYSSVTVEVSTGGGSALYKFNNTIVSTGAMYISEPAVTYMPSNIDKLIKVKVIESGAPDEPCYMYPNALDEWLQVYAAFETTGNIFEIFKDVGSLGESINELSGIMVEVISLGDYAEWFNANTAPVGSGGECDKPHVIEVEELPTENSSEKDVYFCNDVCYKVVNPPRLSMIVNEGGELFDLFETMGEDFAMSLTRVSTKPTENIIPSVITDPANLCIHMYYVEDENDVFVYVDKDSTGECSWCTFTSMLLGEQLAALFTFGGVIYDKNEATEDMHYYVLQEQYKSYHAVNGKLTVTEDTENGVYDVTNVKTLEVLLDLPTISNDSLYLDGPSAGGRYSRSGGTYYRSFVVTSLPAQDIVADVSNVQKTYVADDGHVIKSVTVPAFDISTAKIPCGIAMETYPTTVFGSGDYLDTTGGTFKVYYTNGESKIVELENKYVSGWSAAANSGKGLYVFKVIYTESNITCYTTYEIVIGDLCTIDICGFNYAAVDGMSWRKWVETSFNKQKYYYVPHTVGGSMRHDVGLFSVDGDYVKCGSQIVYHQDVVVHPDDVIQCGENYAYDITFTINDVQYSAKKGMLWREWVDSDYNTDSRYIRMESEIWDTQESKYVCQYDGNHVGSADEINREWAYILGA